MGTGVGASGDAGAEQDLLAGDRPARWPAFANLRNLHPKLMVIDELIVVAGSFNYTEPANDEIGAGSLEARARRPLRHLVSWLLERMPSLSHRYPTGSQIDGAAVGVAILVRTVGSAPLTGPSLRLASDGDAHG